MTCANVQNGQQKNGKLLVKTAEEIPWNKLCVDIIGPYNIRIKGKEPLTLKVVTIIDPVTGWFKVTQYCNKKAIGIANLVETIYLVRYQ